MNNNNSPLMRGLNNKAMKKDTRDVTTYINYDIDHLSAKLRRDAKAVEMLFDTAYVESDMSKTIDDLCYTMRTDYTCPFCYYVAVRMMGVESGNKSHVEERLKALGEAVITYEIQYDGEGYFTMKRHINKKATLA